MIEGSHVTMHADSLVNVKQVAMLSLVQLLLSFSCSLLLVLLLLSSLSSFLLSECLCAVDECVLFIEVSLCVLAPPTHMLVIRRFRHA